MKPKLKICGLMRTEDVRMCCETGVDICGFVTEYPLDVPWNLSREQCRPLIQAVTAPAKSCIVTGGGREEIVELARTLRPDYVQLHFRETLEDTAAVVCGLTPYGIGVIKTIPDSAEERQEQFGTGDPGSCAKLLTEAGVSVILVDARGPSNAASGGSCVDLSLYRRVRESAGCPVMLGGGIKSDNCREITVSLRPDIVDVMTGAELSHGIKSRRLVQEIHSGISG